YALGDATFWGSTGGRRIASPVHSLATATADGYWVAAADGHVFNFGDAPNRGSLPTPDAAHPVIGMAAFGDGYLLASSDGAVTNYSRQTLPVPPSTWPGSPVGGVVVSG